VVSAANDDAPSPMPAPARLHGLREAAHIGYLRGVARALDRLAVEDPASAGFVARMRRLAADFRFEAIVAAIDAAATDGELAS
jgi:hypothetical protein